jgi:hypothetical protein
MSKDKTDGNAKPDKTAKKPGTIGDQRKPPLEVPVHEGGFRIVSPDIHEPEGQDTHE